MATVYLGLGSNLGEREANLREALELLATRVSVGRVSSLYETAPVGYREQPKFLNLVCRVFTELGPFDLLALTREIERALGRASSFPNAPRPIDIDILFYEDQVIDTPELKIPHPRLEERAFVLVPLVELAPHLVHPVSGRNVSQLLGEVEGVEGVGKWGQG